MFPPVDDGKPFLTCPKRQLVDLQCQGVYPTLSVTDARCLGSGKGYSKVQIWTLFSLDRSDIISNLAKEVLSCLSEAVMFAL